MINDLKKYKIQYLHYMTHIDNAPSIFKHGILSRNQVKKLGIEHKDISSPTVQNSRLWQKLEFGKTLYDYVPLYFAVKTPMQYVITTSAPTKNRKIVISNEDLIFIDIDALKVFQIPGIIFTDGNSASSNTNFFYDVSKLCNLDWEVIHGPGDYEGTKGECYSKEWQRKRASEVLVPDCVPVELFSRIVLFSKDAATKLYRSVRKVTDWPKIKMKYSSRDIEEYYFPTNL